MCIFVSVCECLFVYITYLIMCKITKIKKYSVVVHLIVLLQQNKTEIFSVFLFLLPYFCVSGLNSIKITFFLNTALKMIH